LPKFEIRYLILEEIGTKAVAISCKTLSYICDLQSRLNVLYFFQLILSGKTRYIKKSRKARQKIQAVGAINLRFFTKKDI
jgi:hypothetical protein